MARIGKHMATLLSGKVGDLVFAHYLGRPYVRRKPKKRKSQPSPAELAQQNRIKLAVRMLKPFKGLLSLSFADPKENNSGFNRAMSYVINYAIVGYPPEQSIDYSRLLLAHGMLHSPIDAHCYSNAGYLNFSWSLANYSTTDEIILIAYCTDTHTGTYSIGDELAAAGSARLKIPASFRQGKMQAWIAIISQDRKMVSDSVYLGSFH